MSFRILAVLIALAIAGAVAVRWLGGDVQGPVPAPMTQLAADLEAVARAFPPPDSAPIELPRDHAGRPGEFIESWLVAGVLRDDGGDMFGVQLLFERVALAAAPADRASAWSAAAVWRAMLMIEPAGRAVVREDRLSRGALGLAGASAVPVSTWVDDWRIEFDSAGRRMTLEAVGDQAGVRLEIDLPMSRPASFETGVYRGYWQAGLRAVGQIESADRTFETKGEMFLERSWGRAQPAGRGQLALARLWVSDGEGALRCERLQRREGGGVPLLECIASDGIVVAGAEMEPVPSGRQTIDGIEYPLHWRVAAPSPFAGSRLEPLAASRGRAIEGGWRGVLAGQDPAQAWGVLVLSNFGDPALSGGAGR